jgi:hypothetical protein
MTPAKDDELHLDDDVEIDLLIFVIRFVIQNSVFLPYLQRFPVHFHTPHPNAKNPLTH